MAIYTIIGIPRADPLKVRSRTIAGAPRDTILLSWALRHKLAFVIRYFPSKKGWGIYDTRQVCPLPSKIGAFGQAYAQYGGWKRLPRTYASEDAAVMKAIHLANLPVQEELAL